MKDGDTSALDRAIARALERAGIEVARLRQPSGNPASHLRGRLGPIEFARALSGWAATGPLPLAVARMLYKHPVARRETRVAGRADHPPPEGPWIVWYTVNGERVYPVHLQARFRAVCEQSPGLVRMSPAAIFHDEPARIGATAYVDLYHIDSEHGLRVFANVLRAHDVDELARPAWWDASRLGALGRVARGRCIGPTERGGSLVVGPRRRGDAARRRRLRCTQPANHRSNG